MRDPHTIIIQPHITEKSVSQSYGDPRLPDEKLVRKYTFIVARDANKIEIKSAIEAIYNVGKGKKDDGIVVDRVHTANMKGKSRRVNFKNKGKKADRKKAVITLKVGQLLEDYGV